MLGSWYPSLFGLVTLTISYFLLVPLLLAGDIIHYSGKYGFSVVNGHFFDLLFISYCRYIIGTLSSGHFTSLEFFSGLLSLCWSLETTLGLLMLWCLLLWVCEAADVAVGCGCYLLWSLISAYGAFRSFVLLELFLVS